MFKPKRDEPIAPFVTSLGLDATPITSSTLNDQAALRSVQESSSRPRTSTATPSGRQNRPGLIAVPTRDPNQQLTVQKTRNPGPDVSTHLSARPRTAAGGPPSFLRRVTGAATTATRALSNALDITSVNPILGPTPAAAILEAKMVYEDDYFQRSSFRDQHMIQGTEGDIYIVQRRNRPKSLFVVKHTNAMSWSSSDKLPCEAKLLLEQLNPYHRIVEVYESVPDPSNEGRHRIYMEHCDAGDLQEQWGHCIRRPKMAMPEIFLLHVLVQGMEALAFIHHGLRLAGNGQYTIDENHKPIIHGDLKDSNFLLTWTPRPLPEIKLADFGAAKLADARDDRIQPGTLAYHAPEDKAVYGDLAPIPANATAFKKMINRRTTASDMYALGLLVAKYAAREINPMPIGTDPKYVHVWSGYATPGLEEIIGKMLAVNPAERAVASFDKEHGIMSQINEMRKARDLMVSARQLPGSKEWAVPPPEGHPIHLRELRLCSMLGWRDGHVYHNEKCIGDHT